jgi:hypothetical protein
MSASAELVRRVSDRLGDPVLNPPGYRVVARVLGVSHVQVPLYANGSRIMSRHAFAHAARFLNLTPAEVLEYSARLQAEGIKDSDTREWFVRQVAASMRRASSFVALLFAAALSLCSVSSEARASTRYETPRATYCAASLYIMRSCRRALQIISSRLNFKTLQCCDAIFAP